MQYRINHYPPDEIAHIFGNLLYEDEIIILTVIDSSGNIEETEQFITDYKEILKIRFEQEEIFITGQDLTIY